MLRRSLLRYLTVGGLLWIVDTTVFITLHQGLGIDVRIAQVVSRTVGAVCGFFGHKYVSFRILKGERKNNRYWSIAGQGIGYTIVTVLNILVSPFVVQFAIWLVGGIDTGSLVISKLLAEIVLVSETYFLLRVIFISSEGSNVRRS